jgi:hypothetical protein
MSCFPEHDWLEWQFAKPDPNFWASDDNKRRALEWAGNKLGVKNMEDWYQIRRSQLIEIGGTLVVSFIKIDATRLLEMSHSLTGCLSGSEGHQLVSHLPATMPEILRSVYPQHQWLDWKFVSTKKGFWNEPNNRKAFMLWVGETLGVKELSDWARISYAEVTALGGSLSQIICGAVHPQPPYYNLCVGMPCLAHYNHSVLSCAKALYPEHDWSRFDR